MITTLTMNPAIDKAIHLNSIALGEVNRIEKISTSIGGKGINVSKVLNFFEVDNIATGILGSFNSSLFKDFFNEQALNNDFIEVLGNTRINTKICESKNKRITDINEAGLTIDNKTLEDITKKIISLSKSSDYFVLSGSLAKGIDKHFYANIISKIKDNTITVLDTSGSSLKEGIKAGVAIIKPNKEELEAAYNIKLDTNDACIKFSKELIDSTDLKTILLTLGKNGSMHITSSQALFSEIIDVKVKNTVGAGDFFLGGYLSGKSQGLSDYESFLRAQACSNLAVMQLGTDIFTKNGYDIIKEKINIKYIK